MAVSDPRRVLQRLLTSLFQAGEPATVVLATATVQAGEPTPGVGGTTLSQQDLEERADQAVATLVEASAQNRDGDSWVQNWLKDAELELIVAGKDNGGGGFLNGGGGGAFRNGGGGGAFRNGGGGFRNGGGGSFRNSSFRNF